MTDTSTNEVDWGAAGQDLIVAENESIRAANKALAAERDALKAQIDALDPVSVSEADQLTLAYMGGAADAKSYARSEIAALQASITRLEAENEEYDALLNEGNMVGVHLEAKDAAKLQATVAEMREALEEIAPHPHTTDILWWQQIARGVLNRNKEQTDDPS